MLGAAVLLHFAAREAVARAVALAPNAGRSEAAVSDQALPRALVERGAFVWHTEVGPPAATLVSWVVPSVSEPARGTVVLLHGVRMDKRSLLPVALALVDAGYRAVLVDLRGHGGSTGRYLTYGAVEAEDVASVVRSLARVLPLGPVGAFGFSYGGAVALELGALDPSVRAVVAVSTFSSLRGVMGDYERKYLVGPLRLIPDAWFQGAVDEAAAEAGFDPDRQSPLNAVAHSREHLLLIHGSADTQVSPLHSRRLAAAAGPRAKLVTLPGGTHDSMPVDRSGAVRHQTVAWFERWLAPPS